MSNVTTREPGNYHIKPTSFDDWQPAKWYADGGYWMIVGSLNFYEDDELHAIDETRIPAPGEQPEISPEEIYHQGAKDILKAISQGFLNNVNLTGRESDAVVFKAVGETIQNFPLPEMPNGWKEKDTLDPAPILITCERALNMAQAEIRAMHKRLGINGSNVLDIVDEALGAVQNKTT